MRVPRLQFAMLEGLIEQGQGPSSPPRFSEALDARCGISYTLKFMCRLRKDHPVGYPAMALGGL